MCLNGPRSTTRTSAGSTRVCAKSAGVVDAIHSRARAPVTAGGVACATAERHRVAATRVAVSAELTPSVSRLTNPGSASMSASRVARVWL